MGLMLVIQGFVLVIGLTTLLAGAGFALPVPKVALLGAGALLMVLGNYMGKLRRNFFIGIRTPWTIASEATWERTHRLGGKLFALAGVMVLLITAFGGPFWLSIACILAVALMLVVYSFLVYRRLEVPSRD